MDASDYVKPRGGEEEPENKPLRYLLPLEILSEEEAFYGDKNGPAVMIKRILYNEQNKPQHVTLILGKDDDAFAV